MQHPEWHWTQRVGWLRAAVLGANDGIVSTASLIIGVSAAAASHNHIVLAGVAGLVAGAMSMAAGEYVSVSSQSDTEEADLKRELIELENDPEGELHELAEIYENRGLDASLAKKVAQQLSEHDALGAHARDELGISAIHKARPLQAAFASATTFSLGAAMPLLTAIIAPNSAIITSVAITSLASLAVLGSVSAHAGRAPVKRAIVRVTCWGALAMALTAGVGTLFGMHV